MVTYKLDQWAVVARGTPYTPPELMERCLSGICTQHPDFPDAHRVTTSPLRGKTVDGLIVTASGSRIKLGDEINTDYAAIYFEARERLFESLPVID